MAILELPKATAHLLNSAQVLTTPISLAKELIDNALDAKASCIDVLLSPNTLDKIEVRDNGHGIQQDDLDALGRRGHTSKLRTFEELRYLGGTTLGFRGEALASAVRLGEVSVTTKTEGEAVATLVRLRLSGGIGSQIRTSHPVGTTVSVTKFMSKLPVRQKTFEKEAAKTTAKITQLLRSYALARPSIKFTLKITKGGKGCWSFAPRSNGGIKDAVSQVIGRDAALQCIEKSLLFPEKQFSEIDEDNSTKTKTMAGDLYEMNREQLIIEAFLPKADADPSKVGNGQFLSIDSRPVSHEKGTMKKIVTNFKKHIRGYFGDTTDKFKNPFIRLNIKCPAASYDPNVEPAKDDVLFGNEALVLGAFEELLKNVYGEYKVPVSAPPVPAVQAPNRDNFELLLSRRSPASAVVRQSPFQNTTSIAAPSPESVIPLHSPKLTIGSGAPATSEEHNEAALSNKRGRWVFDISKDYSEGIEGYERRNQQVKSPRAVPAVSRTESMQLREDNPLNPWIIAKMNAPVNRENPAKSSNPNPLQIVTPTTPSSRPYPYPGSNAWSDPQSKHLFHNDEVRSSELDKAGSPTQPRAPSETPDAPISLNICSLPFDYGTDLPFSGGEQTPQTRGKTDHVTARKAAQNFLMSPPPSTRISKPTAKSRALNRPFVPPLKYSGNKERDSLRQTKLSNNCEPPIPQNNNHQNVPQNPDLTWAMDFEQRKEGATSRRRNELQASREAENCLNPANAPRSSPHKNRYNAAIASLEIGNLESHDNISNQLKERFKTSLPDDDPRAYLMRRQKSMARQQPKLGEPPKLIRAKSMRLPMERILLDTQVHNLILLIPTEIKTLKESLAKLARDDQYVNRGIHIAGLEMDPDDTVKFAKRLQCVVERWMASVNESGDKPEVENTFGDLLDENLLV
jgi:DNA mismatch repair protein MutL